MELKTRINSDEGKQKLVITREFDLPLELLFKAFEDPEIVEQWMGTKVLKLENKNHGSFQFETTNDKGTVLFRANGVIHEFVPNKNIIRTFEMENAPIGVQLEFLEFEKLTNETSKLTMQVIYKSAEHREQQMRLPFAQGLNHAHNRLQDILNKLK